MSAELQHRIFSQNCRWTILFWSMILFGGPDPRDGAVKSNVIPPLRKGYGVWIGTWVATSTLADSSPYVWVTGRFAVQLGAGHWTREKKYFRHPWKWSWTVAAWGKEKNCKEESSIGRHVGRQCRREPKFVPFSFLIETNKPLRMEHFNKCFVKVKKPGPKNKDIKNMWKECKCKQKNMPECWCDNLRWNTFEKTQ